MKQINNLNNENSRRLQSAPVHASTSEKVPNSSYVSRRLKQTQESFGLAEQVPCPEHWLGHMAAAEVRARARVNLNIVCL